MMNREGLEELLKENRKLDLDSELWKFRSFLDDYQKDLAVLYLIDRLTSEGMTAVEIWNLLAQDEDQYHLPKTQDESDDS